MIYFSPFEEKQMNYLEYFNEITIMAVLCQTILFTDYIDNAYMQYNVGWSVIATTVLNLLVNMTVLIINGFKQMKLMFKMIRYKFR